jgi:hypothetical protein
MSRDQVKDYLEGIGLVAVIASLVFVGIETRNGAIQAELNTEALEMAAYQELIQSIADMNALTLQEPKLRNVSLRLEENETEFTVDELEIASYWLWMRIRHGDMAFFQYQRGAIDESRLRSALAPMVAILTTTYGRQEWQWRQKNFVPEFQDYVNRELERAQASGHAYEAFPSEAN